MAKYAILIYEDPAYYPNISPEAWPAMVDAHSKFVEQVFAIKPLERTKPADRQTYVVALKQPVPDGRIAIGRLRLSHEPGRFHAETIDEFGQCLLENLHEMSARPVNPSY